MDQVVLGGGSAGGNLAGMLVLMSTDQDTAARFGTVQTLNAGTIKCVVFCLGLINNEDFSATSNPFMDWPFLQCGRSAISQGLLRGNEVAHETNLIAWVNADYPPSSISDGNDSTFTLQAQALYDRLDELGAHNRLNLYSREQEVLFHGFETTSASPSATDNRSKAIEFVRQFVALNR